MDCVVTWHAFVSVHPGIVFYSLFSTKLLSGYVLYCIWSGAPALDILAKSRAGMLDEMQRCERLGIAYYNIHPGSTCGKISIDECINLIAESVNQSLEATKDVSLLLENMSCQGNTIGGKMAELAGILAKVNEKFQDRVGVCIDTCHAFAAGNDISTLEGWNAFLEEVDRVIGWEKVKAFHLNDSMFAVGAKKDRHALIGKGKDRKLGMNLSFLCPVTFFSSYVQALSGWRRFAYWWTIRAQTTCPCCWRRKATSSHGKSHCSTLSANESPEQSPHFKLKRTFFFSFPFVLPIRTPKLDYQHLIYREKKFKIYSEKNFKIYSEKNSKIYSEKNFKIYSEKISSSGQGNSITRMNHFHRALSRIQLPELRERHAVFQCNVVGGVARLHRMKFSRCRSGRSGGRRSHGGRGSCIGAANDNLVPGMNHFHRAFRGI